MKTRTMARIQRAETPHTAWCARDHRCGLNEHRSPEMIADAVGGRVTVTRVRAGEVEYAEIRGRIPLGSFDAIARRQVAITLLLLRRLFAAVAAVRPESLPGRADRPAIGRKAA
ncbi:hypothetical protein ACQP2F_45100 [Actinoplanes sp. CA-030573]|uniref:hypothetical protein n=1 Tax=Actinoplanes sp. CA-030573 TaxID=3239898 RepID=UPI003D8F750D